MLIATLTVSDASFRGSKQTNDSETLERSLVRSSAQYETKLVGGNDASKGEYPFFAHWDGCGASVIHDDLVLSAAHCNVPGAGSKVIIGPYTLNDLEGATQRTIVAKAAHPNYDDNDDTTLSSSNSTNLSHKSPSNSTDPSTTLRSVKMSS